MAKVLAQSYLQLRKERHSVDATKVRWTQSFTDTNNDLIKASREVENVLGSVLRALESTTKDYPQDVKNSLDELFGETNSPLKILKVPNNLMVDPFPDTNGHFGPTLSQNSLDLETN